MEKEITEEPQKMLGRLKTHFVYGTNHEMSPAFLYN